MLHIPRWQTVVIALVVLAGALFAAPNLVSEKRAQQLPDWLPHKQINLGLDLQGGSHLLLEVKAKESLEQYLQGVVEEVRRSLRQERIGYRALGVSDGAVSFELRDPGKAGAAREALQDIGDSLRLQLEDGQGTLELTETARRERVSSTVQQSIEVIRRRIDQTGVREPTIQRQGEQRIIVQLPGINDPERMKDILGKTAKLTFHLVRQDISPNAQDIPPSVRVLPSSETGPNDQPVRRYVVEKRAMVSGENLTDAQPSFQQGQPVVSFSFNAVGGRRFAEATKENVGEPFAIVLDEKVISAPVIREPILGGQGVISGDFTTQEARDLALLLRAGALPAPLRILQERTVGPSMGADSVQAGKIASVVALVAVMAFMAAIYGFFGTLTCIGLLVNLMLIMGALSLLQATLTLPGIAGIVLTLGMAVDANVLIFERIREEARNYRGPVSAIDAGYRRAMTTILDANITTLIAALLLYYFGSGPVRGFAVTLSIGVVTSMFTAIMLTRSMVAFWLRRRRPQALPI
ncbi:preprotein translocase subunit SecD [Limimonas halophila]|uniref:Protein translocase subunit SecD n=1 Tax=Limimonas halophila TaxID=1082479 RepID=A0A1G7NHT5_9PROT|nr:protein translocase subunit SecD [Limimonas halophila]SDF73526.1 preprotein translocase subunit SecD [Limimonas halophila]